MKKVTTLLGGACLLLAFAIPAWAHHIIDVDAEVSCEGYSVTASANVFNNHRLLVVINGDTVFDEPFATSNSGNVANVGPFTGPETSGSVEASVRFPNGNLEGQVVTTSFELEEECQEETTTTIMEITTTFPQETTTTAGVSTTATGPTTTVTVPVSSSTPTSVPCSEDDPCWDCSTMGNKICGENPTPPPDEPELPFTGLNTPLWLAIAISFVASGRYLVRRFRSE